MKTYVIALTTYRELIRRPLFWMLAGVAAVLLLLFAYIPYFTLGEDIKMVKDQGLALIMITGLTIALFAASVSIADEIDGKTAITLLSKPITRRDFILGKFGGIMSAIAVLFLILGAVFLAVLYVKANYDARETAQDPPSVQAKLEMLWHIVPGIVLTYFKVAILCALSVAFSTRFPLHLNISACIIILFLGHLAPQMVQASEQRQLNEAVEFMAKVFATVLPGLEYFNVGPAISTDATVPWVGYVLPCLLYCVLYSSIALLLALLLFEDRDLA
jgi:ABC-type transport system involved in multi-copper enzyme maturation permease subunit